MVIQKLGIPAIPDTIGVNATGRKFNSIIAIEDKVDRPSNSLVNAGAIATTSLVSGNTYGEKWDNILSTFSKFAARDLEVNQVVYESEAATNQRNRAIAQLLDAYGRIYYDPMETTDIYTKQCAINVNSHDLSIMAATLANGGVNPVTNEKLVDPQYLPKILAVMTTAGLYDDSGLWLYYVGLPGKSGVGGGVIAVAPGKFGIGAFSPRLDESGNSVRGVRSIISVNRELSINIFYPK
jgi:glutaminase